MTQLTALSGALIASRVDQAVRMYVAASSPRARVQQSSVEVRPDCVIIGASLLRSGGQLRGGLYCLLSLRRLAKVAGEEDLFIRLTTNAILLLLWECASIDWEQAPESRPVLTTPAPPTPKPVTTSSTAKGGLFRKLAGELK